MVIRYLGLEISLDQVLILPCTRTKDESAEMAGNLLIPECLDLCTLSLATPRYKRKHLIKVPENQMVVLCFGLDHLWIRC